MLCAYTLCVMEATLPRVLCIWMNGFYTGNGSSPGNPWLYFPEIEYYLLEVELVHQQWVSRRTKYDGDRVLAGTLAAGPVLADTCACGSANWHIQFPTVRCTRRKFRCACRLCAREHGCILTRIGRAIEKGVGGVTQGIWVTPTQSRYNTPRCHNITSHTGQMDCCPPYARW